MQEKKAITKSLQKYRFSKKKKKKKKIVETANIFSVHSKNTTPVKVWVLIENKAKAEMELDTVVSSVPVIWFRNLLPRHKMFPAVVQLKIATGEIFRPESFVKYM